MDLADVMEQIGRDDVTVTFGVAPPEEVVGPIKPQNVYYGHAFGYDEYANEFIPNRPIPLILFEFNKYRSDLPPWEKTREFVLAATNDGERVAATFIEPHYRASRTTGTLKTVEVSAEGPIEGVDAAIINGDEQR